MTDPPIWSRVPGKALLFLINAVSATALIFEGYNQGVYGTISSTPGFIRMSGIGHDDVVTDSTKQGGLAAVYYFGAMCACFIGGWVGDRIGRKRDVLVGTSFALVGTALQASSRSSQMFICARVITGIGIGFINTVVPTWVTELSQPHNRGSHFSLVFMANFGGIALSSWINFAIRDADDELRWRFPLAWMVVPLIMVDIVIPFLPESPRWLIVNGRRDEAIEVLCKLRGDLVPDDPQIEAQLEQLDAMVEASNHKRNHLLNIVLGGRYSGKLHLGRRAVMGFSLQWLQQWSGILAIVAWAGELFRLAEYDQHKSLWLAALANTVGIPGTAAAALVIDRLGRVKSLMTSFAIQAASLFLIAALTKTAQDAAAADNTDLASKLGTSAASFVFIYVWFFSMFNIIPAWIYGSEIWPQEIRAKGYGFTIFGWATGCGMTQFLIPIMLSRLGYGTYLVFGCINILCMPVVWLLFPELASHTLEETLLLFTSDSALASRNTSEYRRRVDEVGGNSALAVRRLLNEVDRYATEGNMSDEEVGIDRTKEALTTITTDAKAKDMR